MNRVAIEHSLRENGTQYFYSVLILFNKQGKIPNIFTNFCVKPIIKPSVRASRAKQQQQQQQQQLNTIGTFGEIHLALVLKLFLINKLLTKAGVVELKFY